MTYFSPNFAVPIRSCREFLERCHSKTDGLYTIYLQKPNSAETGNVFCDMTHDNGGWTLMITSATNQGWTKDNVKSRYVHPVVLFCPARLSLFYIYFLSLTCDVYRNRFWLFHHHHLSFLSSWRLRPFICLLQATRYFATPPPPLAPGLESEMFSLLVDRFSPRLSFAFGYPC